MFWGINNRPEFPLELQKELALIAKTDGPGHHSVIPVYRFKMLPDIMATAQEWMSHKM